MFNIRQTRKCTQAVKYCEHTGNGILVVSRQCLGVARTKYIRINFKYKYNY